MSDIILELLRLGVLLLTALGTFNYGCKRKGLFVDGRYLIIAGFFTDL